ncbi:hypothetical protein LCGC14_1733280 [marine sediment metagenome]|uniref:Uncharacterized protein n=1 Tax=marine sediment metagenome TaxID=412755 RepID=A0A0F9H8W4_9ZZZZ
MNFLFTHWEWVLIGFYALEKAVKISPLVWDDIIVDGIRSIFKALENIRKGY